MIRAADRRIASKPKKWMPLKTARASRTTWFTTISVRFSSQCRLRLPATIMLPVSPLFAVLSPEQNHHQSKVPSSNSYWIHRSPKFLPRRPTLTFSPTFSLYSGCKERMLRHFHPNPGNVFRRRTAFYANTWNLAILLQPDFWSPSPCYGCHFANGRIRVRSSIACRAAITRKEGSENKCCACSSGEFPLCFLLIRQIHLWLYKLKQSFLLRLSLRIPSLHGILSEKVLSLRGM